MMIKLFLFLLPLSIFAQYIVWSEDSKGTLTQAERDEAVKVYVDEKYPLEVESIINKTKRKYS